MMRNAVLSCFFAFFYNISFAESIETIFMSALENSPEYRGVVAAYNADQAGVDVAFGRLLPNLSATFSNSKSSTDSKQGVAAENHYNYVNKNSKGLI